MSTFKVIAKHGLQCLFLQQSPSPFDHSPHAMLHCFSFIRWIIGKHDTVRFWILLGLLLFAGWIGIRGINADPIWIDEYWTIYNAGGAHYGPLAPSEIFTRIAQEDIWHVPLYYLLIAAWGSLVGWSDAALRYFSVLCGLLSIAMVYRVGRMIDGPFTGLAAAITVGTSAFYLYYFHELRSYSLGVLVVAAVIGAYWQVKTTYHPRALSLFFVSVLTLFYTHYLLIPILIALGGYHLWFVPKNRAWWMITGAVIFAGLCFLPWTSVTLRAWQEASSPDNVALRDWGPGVIEINALLLLVFGNGSLALPLFGVYLFSRRPRSETQRFLAIVLALLAGIVLLLNLAIALFVVIRYLLPLWVILALIIGMGVRELRPYRLGRVFLAIWALTGVWSATSPDFIRPYLNTRILSHTPWDSVASSLSSRYQPGDQALFLLPDETWHVWQDWVAGFYLDPVGIAPTLIESYPQTPDRAYRDQAVALTAPRIWLGYHPDDPPLAWYTFSAVIPNHYTLCPAPIQRDSYQVDLYAQVPERYPFSQGVGVHLLEPLRVEHQTLTAIIGIAIAPEITPESYSVGLHVFDQADQLIAQVDYGLVAADQPFQARRCTVNTFPNLTAGSYRLAALVYHWQTGDRLTVNGSDRLTLGEFVIPQE